jgi:capsid portal protein
MDATTEFINHNVHHSNCIETKRDAICGLGMKNEKIETRLDKFCRSTWTETISDVMEDRWINGNGYLEVVRAVKSGAIRGLHHIPAPRVFIVVEENGYDFHYEIVGSTNGAGNTARFARFGDYKRFSRLYPDYRSRGATYSEIVHFRQPSSQSKWYGVPGWLSAVAAIELVQCMHQFSYDFYLNRGVPEFMLFLLGKEVDKPTWDNIQKQLQGGIGLGKSHKSLLANLPDEGMTVQLEKLAVENSDKDFGNHLNYLALEIVTAHRVPPALANIQVPGKLGATNELPNAILSFQSLVIGPAQRLVQTTLFNTIGRALQMRRSDFTFNTIADEVYKNMPQVKTADVQARMKDSPLSGRNPADGLLNDANKRTTQRNQGLNASDAS